MKKFLEQVLQDVVKTEKDNFNQCIFILPSIRAGSFFKKTYTDQAVISTSFLPQILSIEEFISDVSGLKKIDSVYALCEFYSVYKKVKPKQNKDSFEMFCRWAPTVIQDFNEIDCYCVNTTAFFGHLADIYRLEQWDLNDDKTSMISNYSLFWENLSLYYEEFKTALLEKGLGYQGLLYRFASYKMQSYIKNCTKKHVFIGFNALNKAEQDIFQELLASDLASIYWDGDRSFFNNYYHSAATFQRVYKNKWPYYQKAPFTWLGDHFSNEKEISIIGIPKNIGQAKVVGELIADLPKESLDSSAIILGDESLLKPIIDYIPNATKGAVNITMGQSLENVPLAIFFENLFHLQQSFVENKVNHKLAIELLRNHIFQYVFGEDSDKIIIYIIENNITYVSSDFFLLHVSKNRLKIAELLFKPWSDSVLAIQNCKEILRGMGNESSKGRKPYIYAYLPHFELIFNKLLNLHSEYGIIVNFTILVSLFKEFLSNELLSFTGEPLNGLQVMGMLESRSLDYETVIVTSMNEGVLPKGKSMNTFIPFDLRKAFNLPTYSEKDAIYAYHFYRLIQRAKNVYLTYNTDNEGVGGGEPSRFLRQLMLYQQSKHKINKQIVTSNVILQRSSLLNIKKTPEILSKLKNLMLSGLSPTAITTYIKNPIDFYHKYVLDIKETENVEEVIQTRTLGTILHKILEELYKPFENKNIELSDIIDMKAKIDQMIHLQFKLAFMSIDIKKGKNLLIYKVVRRYLDRFLCIEEGILRNNSNLIIKAIEKKIKIEINIPEVDYPVVLKGTVDRIDLLNNQLRVIDYKSGKVTKTELTIYDLEELTSESQFYKIIQVLLYAYLYNANESQTYHSIQAGVISFKNLNEGFLKFGTKQSVRGKINNEINLQTLTDYMVQLKKIIKEILDPNIPFIEKEQ